MHKALLIIPLLVLFCHSLYAQKYNRFESGFSIIEKNTLKDSSYVVVGDINYDLFNNITTYDITFPEKSKWVMQDSIMTKFDSTNCVIKVDTVGTLNELSIFNKILTNSLTDFGLLASGFTLSNVEKIDSSVIFQWKPPEQVEFLNYLVTEQVDERLVGLIVVDENDKEINKTYYQDYITVKGLPVPREIKSHYVGKEEQIFKIIKFRDVEIY